MAPNEHLLPNRSSFLGDLPCWDAVQAMRRPQQSSCSPVGTRMSTARLVCVIVEAVAGVSVFTIYVTNWRQLVHGEPPDGIASIPTINES